ncbi:uncharacterized protein EDB91DRAFT_1090501, partial [Suillus paluster]|uniref:uncharacterized protein n=1 Tax=Suillus paluster TaxID=48578 RepID=UPI001B873E44
GSSQAARYQSLLIARLSVIWACHRHAQGFYVLFWPSMYPGTGHLELFFRSAGLFFQFSSRHQFNIEDHTDLHYSFGGLHLLCLPPFLNKFNPSSAQMYYPLWAFSGHVMLKSLPNF